MLKRHAERFVFKLNDEDCHISDLFDSAKVMRGAYLPKSSTAFTSLSGGCQSGSIADFMADSKADRVSQSSSPADLMGDNNDHKAYHGNGGCISQSSSPPDSMG